MPAPSRIVLALFVVSTLAPGSDAAAQAPDARPAIVAKAGFNRETAEDGLRGGAWAGGLAVTLPFNDRWSGELEVWVPGRFRDGPEEHRDIPISGSLVRHFRAGPTRPFLLVGLSLARTETSFFGDTFSTTTSYALLGTGVAITVGRRFALVPEVRTHLAITSVIVRPSLGVAVYF